MNHLPAYKEKNNTWSSKFKYKDWLGKTRQKCKRGFLKKKDALDYEMEFKSKYMHTPDIMFSALVDNYMRDMIDNKKIAVTTAARKQRAFNKMITPFFNQKPINTIDELDVLNWQTAIQKQGNDLYPGKGYAPTYLKSLNNELNAIMNYAVRYYKLSYNPCERAGSMGKGEADAMQIWTLDQYEQFISYADKSGAKVAFDILFWTGIREGELLALTPADFHNDLKLNIDKSFVVLNGEYIIKEPKNESSIRQVPIPQFLYDEVQEYMSKLYGLQPHDRLFMFTKSFLLYEIKRLANMAGLEPIRVHDLRHSHVSLLIEMGFNILMISERLGHKNVQTTWKTYAHLYPDKGKQIAFGLQEVRATGITQNKTAEDQVLSLLGEIQKVLPNYHTYENDDIVLWDCDKKEKTIINRIRFNELVSKNLQADEAFVVMMKDGYYEIDSRYVCCFASRGLPFKYL